MAARLTWKVFVEGSTLDSESAPTRLDVPAQTTAPTRVISQDERMTYGQPSATVEIGIPSTLDSGSMQHIVDAFVVLELVNGGSAATLTAQSYTGVNGATARAKTTTYTLSKAKPRAIAILPGDSSGVTAVYPDTTLRRVFTLTAGDDVRLRCICATDALL